MGPPGICPKFCNEPFFTAGHNYLCGEDLTNREGSALILKNEKVYISTIANDKKIIGFLGYTKSGPLSITNETVENLAYVVGLGDSFEWENKESIDTSGNIITNNIEVVKGVNVCNENGNIEIGDLLTTSNKPGYFMKQTDDLIHSYTAGKCMEDIIFDETGEKTHVYCIMMCG